MGNLPKDRTKSVRDFIKCGVDFVVLVHINSSLRHTAPTYKDYICVWMCLVTKAVHIELVRNLTTKHFKMRLNEFSIDVAYT